MPLLAAGVLYAGAEREWSNSRIRKLAAQVEPLPWGYASACHNGVPVGERDLAPCTRGGHSGRRVILLGDSNAAQYGEALEVAGDESGRPVTVATMPFCPFVDIEIHQPGVDWQQCHTYVRESTQWLRSQSDVTLVVAATNEMIASSRFRLTDPTTGRTASSPSMKADVWADGMTRTLDALRSPTRDVIVVSTIPHFFRRDQSVEPWWAPTQCDVVTLLTRFDSCTRSKPLAAMTRQQGLALRAERKAVARAKVFELDLRARLCRDAVCRTNIGERWVYRDGWHISTGESRRLAPLFVSALEASSKQTPAPDL